MDTVPRSIHSELVCSKDSNRILMSAFNIFMRCIKLKVPSPNPRRVRLTHQNDHLTWRVSHDSLRIKFNIETQPHPIGVTLHFQPVVHRLSRTHKKPTLSLGKQPVEASSCCGLQPHSVTSIFLSGSPQASTRSVNEDPKSSQPSQPLHPRRIIVKHNEHPFGFIKKISPFPFPDVLPEHRQHRTPSAASERHQPHRHTRRLSLRPEQNPPYNWATEPGRLRYFPPICCRAIVVTLPISTYGIVILSCKKSENRMLTSPDSLMSSMSQPLSVGTSTPTISPTEL